MTVGAVLSYPSVSYSWSPQGSALFGRRPGLGLRPVTHHASSLVVGRGGRRGPDADEIVGLGEPAALLRGP
jgi:hypothetical protein